MVNINQTVAQIVAADYRAAGVFKKHGMDFCCGGKRPVIDACEKHGIDSQALINELNQVTMPIADSQIDFGAWTPELLITYIQEMHHSYVKEAIPRISQFTQKVAMRHGETDPDLVEIHHTFVELGNEMMSHLADEDDRVFPAIRTFSKTGSSDVTEMREMLDELEQEHEHAGALMARLRVLTHGFNPPEWACNTFRVSFAELDGFEADLHKHVHLENNILFAKVERLVEKMSENSD
jgi:regulator of cell morphogenesis and NO signaling